MFIFIANIGDFLRYLKTYYKPNNNNSEIKKISSIFISTK